MSLLVLQAYLVASALIHAHRGSISSVDVVSLSPNMPLNVNLGCALDGTNGFICQHEPSTRQ